MRRDEKKSEVERLRAELAKSGSVFVMGFQKIPVSEDLELRRQVRGAGGRYQVVKNTLAELSAQGTPAEQILKALSGPTALATTETSPVALAKALTAYAKANPNFTFRAGLVESRVVSLAEITELAVLPSKEELLAKVLGLINAPARGVAMALQAVVRNMASVMDQAVKEGKFNQ